MKMQLFAFEAETANGTEFGLIATTTEGEAAFWAAEMLDVDASRVSITDPLELVLDQYEGHALLATW